MFTFKISSKCEIGLTEQEIDDIIVTLDSNMDDELDYQEINKGLMQWKKNRRDLKKQGLLPKTLVLSCQGEGSYALGYVNCLLFLNVDNGRDS